MSYAARSLWESRRARNQAGTGALRRNAIGVTLASGAYWAGKSVTQSSDPRRYVCGRECDVVASASSALMVEGSLMNLRDKRMLQPIEKQGVGQPVRRPGAPQNPPSGVPKRQKRTLLLHALGLTACAGALLPMNGCGNNPYPPGEAAGKVLYISLADDPKTLDPSVAYDVGTAAVIDVLYPAYFQYHYLKRDPFVLELGLGAEEPKRESYTLTATVNGKPVTQTGEKW